MTAMSLGYLQQWHRLLIEMCRNPFPDENVDELRRLRSLVAERIAAWPTTGIRV
jgi:hypothetical protein